MTDPAAIKPAIREEALALGFDACGFGPASLPPEAGERLRRALQDGHHGTMGWMEERVAQRSDPRALWPEAGTVVALGLSYAPGHDPMETLARRSVGNVSVYARGDDYHDVVKKRLKRLGRWAADRFGCDLKVFVDTAPVMEKPLGQQAGIGWQGKHTNLVSREHGSWLFLGAIYLGLELPPDEAHPDRCGSCDACQAACPTDAFPAPYRLDARRCISYLTIEHAGPIPLEFRAAMGNRVYGCDDCLAVCPWNKFAQATREAKLAARAELAEPPLADLLALDDAAFRALFRKSPVKRTGRDRFVRNCCVAAGNSADPSLLAPLTPLLADASPLVRGAAAWAWAELGGDEGTLAERRAVEDDPGVRAELSPLPLRPRAARR